MARRLGSAMISKSDSMSFIYSSWHIRVKAYKGGGRRGDERKAEAAKMPELRLRFFLPLFMRSLLSKIAPRLF